VLAVAEFMSAPEHVLISQLALDMPRVFEATGVGLPELRKEGRNT